MEYPDWAIALGWCMIIFCIMWIPIIAIVKVVQAEGSTLYQVRKRLTSFKEQIHVTEMTVVVLFNILDHTKERAVGPTMPELRSLGCEMLHGLWHHNAKRNDCIITCLEMC